MASSLSHNLIVWRKTVVNIVNKLLRSSSLLFSLLPQCSIHDTMNNSSDMMTYLWCSSDLVSCFFHFLHLHSSHEQPVFTTPIFNMKPLILLEILSSLFTLTEGLSHLLLIKTGISSQPVIIPTYVSCTSWWLNAQTSVINKSLIR